MSQKHPKPFWDAFGSFFVVKPFFVKPSFVKHDSAENCFKVQF